jgi:uncharacterized protein YbaP (TraB family)
MSTKNKGFFSLVFCLILLVFFGSNPVSAFSDEDGRSPFLWKTRIGESHVYLAGSIHCGRAGDYPLHKAYLEALDAAQTVIFEVAEDKQTLNGLLMEFIEDYRVPEEKYLRRHLSEQILDIFNTLLGEKKAAIYEQYMPWVGHMQSVASLMKLADCDPLRAVDFYLRRLSVEKGKTILGLEDPLDQFRLFEMKIPFETQIQLVENILRSAKIASQIQAKLFDYYYDCDQDGFAKHFLSMYDFNNPASKAGYEKFIASRNRGMVDNLEKTVINSPGIYLVVVGSGHYFGPDNILQLLRTRGYTVEDY